MAEQGVGSQRKLWLGAYNLSTDMQAMTIGSGIEPQDNTVFGDSFRSNFGGLAVPRFESEGLWQAGTDQVDPVLNTAVGVADTVLTMGAQTGAAGERAYFFRALVADYVPGGPVGELFKFTVSATGSGGGVLIPGTLLHNASVTATGNGTAYQVGAVSSSQFLYAAIHVVTVSGTNPTLDVIVKSDDVENFGGTPATQITFAQATGITSEYATRVAGAITDDWWRVEHTITGSDTPTFEYIVTIGIL